MPGPLSRAFSTIRKKPPTAPDGLTEAEAAPHVDETSVIHDLVHLRGKNAVTVLQAVKEISAGEPIDDRHLLLEHGVSLLQGLPANSGLARTASDGLIGMLHNETPHPVASLLGPQHKFRTADGSNNSTVFPKLGAAGTPYAQTVPPVTAKSPNLPDPELVFDQLLRRPAGTFKEHPSGLNRLFFSFATLVIHNCFSTSRSQPWINETSSYVDLAPIYGDNQEQQDSVRTHVNGKLHPDTVASDRIMMMPSGVVAVTLMFARHHNHIAERLLQVNEGGKYRAWDSLDAAQKKKQDEEIFQFARNVNVAFFASVVLRDYVKAILNCVRANSEWHLELGKEIKQGTTRVDRGSGNQVSAEFAVLYHWHAALSAQDDKWMADVIQSAVPDKAIDDITVEDFGKVAMQHGAQLRKTPPREWTFGGLRRTADGHFNDEELATILKDCVEEPAHAFGARCSPSSMRVIEVMGMLQARNAFNVCTLNEFRRYLNLKPFASFDEWNPDEPDVAAAAQKLYGHIDAMELYPGLHAEQAKPAMPGSGVQPGHTVGRGILVDAVALVRGDRFLTTDLNATTLTNWGLAQLKPNAGAYGGMLATILFRGLPNAFGGYSTYALLPFYTPKAIRVILKANGVLDKYDTARPTSSRFHGVHSYDGCVRVFKDRDAFRVPYAPDIFHLSKGLPFFICHDDHHRHDPALARMHKAFFEAGFEQHVDAFYRRRTRELIKQRHIEWNHPKGRAQLNVVRDICNVVPVEWIAKKYGVPLKTTSTPKGLITVHEFHTLMVALFILCSFNQLPASQFLLRSTGEEHGATITAIFEARMKTNGGGLAEKIHDAFAKGSAYEMSPEADHLYHTLIKEKVDPKQAATDLLGTSIPVIGNITQQTALLVDLFLSPGYEYAKDRLVEMAKRDDPADDDEFEAWINEGMRHQPVVFGLPRLVANDTIFHDGERTLHLKAGEKLIIATSRASMDPNAFPNPERLDPTRPKSSYIHMGVGLHVCFGARLVAPSIRAMLREIFALPNIRRARYGGKLDKITETLGEDAADLHLYVGPGAAESPVPTSMNIEFDV